MSLYRTQLDRNFITEIAAHFIGRSGQQVMTGPLLPAAAHTGSIGSADRPWKEGHFDYLTAHAELHATIFSYDQVNAVNGRLIISNATQLGAPVKGYYEGLFGNRLSTIRVKDPVFTYDADTGVGSLIVVKDKIVENGVLNIYTEYMVVRSNASNADADGLYSYTVYRGYGNTTPVAWPKDTVLTEIGRVNLFGGQSYNQGQWDGGWVEMAGGDNGYIAVYERTGIETSAYKARVVMGNLSVVTDADLGQFTGFGLYVDGGKEGGRVFVRGQMDVIGDSRVSRTLTIGSPVGPGTTFYDGYDPQCFLTKAVNPGATLAQVDSTARFPGSGAIYIGSEYVTYSGKTAQVFTGLSAVAQRHYPGERVYLSTARRRYGMESRTEENRPYWTQFFDVRDRFVYWRVAEPGLRGQPDKVIIELIKEAGLASLGEDPSLLYYHLKINAGALFGTINAQNVTVSDLSAIAGEFGEIKSAAIAISDQEYNSYLTNPPGKRNGVYMWNLSPTSAYYDKYNPAGNTGPTRGFEFWRTPEGGNESRQGYWDYDNGRFVWGKDDAVWLDDSGLNFLTSDEQMLYFVFPLSQLPRALKWWDAYGDDLPEAMQFVTAYGQAGSRSRVLNILLQGGESDTDDTANATMQFGMYWPSSTQGGTPGVSIYPFLSVLKQSSEYSPPRSYMLILSNIAQIELLKTGGGYPAMYYDGIKDEWVFYSRLRFLGNFIVPTSHDTQPEGGFACGYEGVIESGTPQSGFKVIMASYQPFGDPTRYKLAIDPVSSTKRIMVSIGGTWYYVNLTAA